MSRKPEYSRKIIKILGEKPAISVPELLNRLPVERAQNTAKYAISRSLKGLTETGLVESMFSGQQSYARLTKEGKKKLYSLRLEEGGLVNTAWDGKWRIVLLDLPETRKDEREALRYLLKKAGFVCLKNATWISPLPYEYLFMNIKKDLGLTTEIMIFVTDQLDEETEEEFLKLIK